MGQLTKAAVPCALYRPIGRLYNRVEARTPEVICVHWTVSAHGNVETLARYLSKQSPEGSYHYGVDRAGAVAEYVRPVDVSWHAGDGNVWHPETLSSWDLEQRPELATTRNPWSGSVPRDFETATKPIERHAVRWLPLTGDGGAAPKQGTGVRFNWASVGIGLCNAGPLSAKSGGVPGQYDRPGFIRMKGGKVVGWTHFEPYTAAQLFALDTLVIELAALFPSLRFVCGHQDVTRRKGDPGPLLADWRPPIVTGLRRIRYDWKLKTWGLLS